jgi:hypothetical protein
VADLTTTTDQESALRSAVSRPKPIQKPLGTVMVQCAGYPMSLPTSREFVDIISTPGFVRMCMWAHNMIADSDHRESLSRVYESTTVLVLYAHDSVY